MLFAKRPIDRAYIYFFNDNDSPQVHGSSGLTRMFKPKPSFYAVSQLYHLLGDTRFVKVIREDRQAYVYAFKQDDSGRQIWVAWSPTGVVTDRKDLYKPQQHQIILKQLPGSGRVDKVIPMATSSKDPGVLAFSKDQRSLNLTVSESPCYIIFK